MWMSKNAFGEGSEKKEEDSTRRPSTGFAAVSRRGSSGFSSGRPGTSGGGDTSGGYDYFRPSAGPAASSGRRPATAMYPGRHGSSFAASRDEPASRGSGGGSSAVGSAGMLPGSKEARQALMDRQRQQQLKTRQRKMMGGPIASTRASTHSQGITSRAAPQTSAPKMSPEHRPGGSGGGGFAAVRGSPPRASPPTETPSDGPDARTYRRPDPAVLSPGGSDFGEETVTLAPSTRAVPSSDPRRRGADARDDHRDDRRDARDHARGDAHGDPRDAYDGRRPTASAGAGAGGEASAVEDDLRKRGLETTYDPNPSPPTGSLTSVAMRRAGLGGKEELDFSDMNAFLNNPLPRSAGPVLTYIERMREGTKKLYPVYQLYLKDGDRFLLAAKKRPRQKTSNYLISSDASDMDRDSETFMGKLRSNFVGTEFTVYDNGVNPKDAKKKSNAGKAVRQELATCTYASNVFGSRGPRKMKVRVPRVGHDNKRRVFQPMNDKEGILAAADRGDEEDLVTLINKPPKWNDQVGAYVLNFNGRVTMASVKNFQLVTPDDHDTVVLQFGRVGKDLFTMDVQHPLSILQAMSICLSSFDYKLACE